MTDQRLKEITCMLQFLKMALKYCEPCKNIVHMRYEEVGQDQLVVVSYEHVVYEGEKPYTIVSIFTVNVNCDSNIAMINDVMTAINHYFC
ncbi:MAG: hypothetical protein J6S67_01460 [Methanobrevibacter sp.]|nr:hypothetical protein [Methanobrevibacter sp.]